MPWMNRARCLGECSSRFKLLTSHEGPYNVISLRFYSGVSEQAYAKACKAKLVKSGFSSSLLLVLGVLLTLAIAQVKPVPHPEDHRFGFISTLFVAAVGSMPLLNALLTTCTNIHACMSPFLLEICFTIGIFLSTVMACVADRYYVAKVSGVVLPAADACMSDSNVLLLLSIYLSHARMFIYQFVGWSCCHLTYVLSCCMQHWSTG